MNQKGDIDTRTNANPLKPQASKEGQRIRIKKMIDTQDEEMSLRPINQCGAEVGDDIKSRVTGKGSQIGVFWRRVAAEAHRSKQKPCQATAPTASWAGTSSNAPGHSIASRGGAPVANQSYSFHPTRQTSDADICCLVARSELTYLNQQII